MAEIITMPRLSDTMTEGTVATWLKKVGDKISEGDILAEIETDKATMEFESFYSGTLLHIGVQEGETAAVDSVLAIIGNEGEDYKALLEGGKSDSSEEKSETKQEATASEGESVSEEPTAKAEIPAGVEIITMPRLSDTMTEGTVAAWLKKVGDKVSEGDILAEIETDKATMEFESFYSGTLLHIGIQEGASAPVDSVLAIIGPEGTDVSGVLSGRAKPVAKTEKKEEIAAEPKEEKQPSASETATNNTGRIFASPLAKKIAQDKGIDLSQVKGTGENGRIVKSDVENFTPETKAQTAEVKSESVKPAQVAVPAGETKVEEVKNSQMRKTIARRLAESKFTAPHYYLTVELNMDNAMEARKTINSLPDTKVSFNDMVVKACAM
ncbi:MAG TPA: biotin/lipoyl-containing protein, partial [Flavobacterium sp.]|nr:biotin/lipoyl-containing protein [Flavobacterium sp.]